MGRLEGKVAVVTGAGRGIGEAIAFAYAEAGAAVGLLARTATEIARVAEQLRERGHQAEAIACDVADGPQVERHLAAIVARLGGLHILVNNAGGGSERKNVGDDDPEQWRRVIEVNLLGTYHVSRATVPHLKASGGGTIINIGSGMGYQAKPGNSSYHTAKAGVGMLTRCLAVELWEHGITVNELIPGPVATKLTAGLFVAGEAHPSIPSEHVKRPQEVAPLALFLAEQAPEGPTGQSFSLARRPLN